MHILLRVFRYLSYFFFAVVGGAAIVAGIVELTNACPGFSSNTGLVCDGAWYEGLANVALGILLTSLLTLIPAVLAIAGLIFAVIDLSRRRRRAAQPQG
jgi:hypothetical protein